MSESLFIESDNPLTHLSVERSDKIPARLVYDHLGYTAVAIDKFCDYFSPDEVTRLGSGDFEAGILHMRDLALTTNTTSSEGESPLRAEVMRRLADT